MKNAFKYVLSLAVGAAIAASCDKQPSPERYSRPQYEPKLEDVSPLSLHWDCDDLKVQTITLSGKDLLPKFVNCVSSAVQSAFNLNCNGDMIHVSPKAINTSPDNIITEQLTIYISEDKLYSVTLSQGRMDKPLLVSLTPSTLSWKHDELSEKTVEIEALNFEPDLLNIKSNVATSHFRWSLDGTTIKLCPLSKNENPYGAIEEIITVSLGAASSLEIKLKQAKAPTPSVELFSTAFDDVSATSAFSFKAQENEIVIDNKVWKMSYACLTTYYSWDSSSHILMCNRKNADSPYVESGNLLSKASTVTSFSVDLSRKADEGSCKIEYSYDGTAWIVADTNLLPKVSSSSSEEYTYRIAEPIESEDFRIKVSYQFPAAPTAFRFLHYEAVNLMGY